MLQITNATVQHVIKKWNNKTCLRECKSCRPCNKLFEDLDHDKILIDEKSYENILI